MIKNMGCEVSIQVHPMPQNEIPEVAPEIEEKVKLIPTKEYPELNTNFPVSH